MAIAEREATVVWNGALESGSGAVVDSTSTALNGHSVTWASRTEEPNEKTSPEELLAAAHATCYAMQLSGLLTENGTAPQKLEVSSLIVLDKTPDGPGITEDKLVVRATVPGLSAHDFDQIAQKAKDICPVSRFFTGGTGTITLDAELAED